MSIKTFEAEVDVSLAEWSADELIHELKTRQIDAPGAVGTQFYQDLYIAIVTDDAQARDELLRVLIYNTTGRILP